MRLKEEDGNRLMQFWFHPANVGAGRFWICSGSRLPHASAGIWFENFPNWAASNPANANALRPLMLVPEKPAQALLVMAATYKK